MSSGLEIVPAASTPAGVALDSGGGAAGNFAADKKTNVVQQSDNAYPYLWNITPKS